MYGNTGYGGMRIGRAPRSPILRNYLDQKQSQPAPQPTFGNPTGSIPQAPRYTGSPMLGAPTMQPQGQSYSPYAPQSVAPQPTMQQAPMGAVQKILAQQPNRSAPDNHAEAVKGWDQDQLDYWNRIASSIKAMPDFEGKNAMYHTALAQLEQLFNLQNMQPDVDLSGYSEVADQYGSQRDRLLNDLAAGGFGGSGVMAGALSNLAGSQARAQGSFVRDALEQRRREELAQLTAYMNRLWQMQGQGLDRVYAKEDEPGFWEDALGVVGGIAGSVIPGVGDVVGGLFGGGDKPKPASDGYVAQDDDYGFFY